MSPQAADPQEPFRAIAEKFAKEWDSEEKREMNESKFVISPLPNFNSRKRQQLFERAIRLTVEATRPSLFDLCECGHVHVGAEVCMGCDCTQQRKYTMDEYLAEIASRLAELLDKEQT